MTTDPQLSKKVDELTAIVETLKQNMADLQKQIEEVGRRAGNFQQFGDQPKPYGTFNPSLLKTPCLREGKSFQEGMMLYCGCNVCSPNSLTVNTGVAVNPVGVSTIFDITSTGIKENNGKD